MEKVDSNYKVHIFICTSDPVDKDSCAKHGSEELRLDLKKQLKDKYGKSIRVNKSGCLGKCKKAVAVMIYPQGIGLELVKPSDKDEIIKIVDELMAEQ